MNEDYKQVSWRNWQVFRPFLMGLLMVGLIASLAGCGGLSQGESEPPLHLPSVAPGSPCPVTTEQKVSPYFGLALGRGPIYPVAGWKHGVYEYHGAKQTNGWFYLKVLWIGRPEYQGNVLIRGRQIDGSHDLQLSIQGPDSSGDLELSLAEGSGGSNPGGWSGWPSYTLIQVPGCYAYQVDGDHLSEVIVFQALDRSV